MAGIATTRIAIVAALAVLLVVAGSASATDIHVHAGESIQAVVGAAIPGDTIIVHDGTYIENVVVSTSGLTIRSDNGTALTKVEAKSPHDHVFEVTKNKVNITGFTVTGATGYGCAGIYLKGQRNICSNGLKQCNITDNIVTGNRIGIRLCNSDNNTIACNWVHHNNKHGFVLSRGSTGNTIEHNNIIENGILQDDGSYRWQFSNLQLCHVNATNNYWGTDNGSVIKASIFLKTASIFLKNPTRRVDYEPFLTTQAPCAPVPELPTIALLAVGLLALVGCGRTKRKE